MKNSSILLVFIYLLFSACQSEKAYFENALCIQNISIVNPEEGLKENQTVVIQDGKILKVIASNEIALDEKNEIIDGTGQFLIPGLWDAHVHFAYLEDLAPSMFNLFLAYGITSVRDTGGEIGFVKEWKDKATADPANAPRVMIAGPLLDGMPNVYDGSTPERPPLSVGLGDIEAVENQIQYLDSLGVDLLKAYEMLTPEQFIALTRMAKEKDLKVTGHVPLSMDVISASNAGLNSMEHMRNLELSCASNSDQLLAQRHQLLLEGQNDPGGILRTRLHQTQRPVAVQNYDEARADEVLQVLAKNQTWQIPTLALNLSFTHQYYADPIWESDFTIFPDTIAQNWKEGIAGMMESEPSDFTKDYAAWKLNMVKKIHEHQIPIMAGTDCPIAYLTPGRSLHYELKVLVEAGLTPLEALNTATLNPAQYFNMEKDLGSIHEGKLADLVLLEANPLENIENTLKISGVIRAGNYLGKEDLEGLLEN